MTTNGEPPSKKKKVPSYAVINLAQNDDIGDLLSVLMGRGYSNVCFLNKIYEHPEAIAYTESMVNAASVPNGSTGLMNLVNAAKAAHSNKVLLSNGRAQGVESDVVVQQLIRNTKPIMKMNGQPKEESTDQQGDDNTIREGTPDSDSADPVGSTIDRVIAQNVAIQQTMKASSRNEMQNRKVIHKHHTHQQRLSAGIPINDIHRSGSYSSHNGRLSNHEAQLNEQSHSRDVIRVNEPLFSANNGGSQFKSRHSSAAQQLLDDPNVVLVVCKLCDNKIMSSRLSNLTNHVRRHAATKQFTCVHCAYQHNEQAKVRLHMSNNHRDTESAPLDNMTPELQKIWTSLMDQCFPGYMDDLRAVTGADAAKMCWGLKGRQITEQQESMMRSQQSRPKQHYIAQPLGRRESIKNCIECGDAVSAPEYTILPAINVFEQHIVDKHMGESCAYECTECQYKNVCEWKMRFHMAERHPENADQLNPVERPMAPNIKLFILKYFPNATGVPRDMEEEWLIAKLEHNKREPVDCQVDKMSGASTVKVEDAENSNGSTYVGGDVYFEDNSSRESATPIELNFRPKRLSNGAPVPPNCVACRLCHKIFDYQNKTSLCGLMAHAKRHYHVKQFECCHCNYASSEAAHVRSHLAQKHSSHDKPVDRNCEEMQVAWIHTMKDCFPVLRDRIDTFRFKTGNFRSSPIKVEPPCVEEPPKKEESPMSAEQSNSSVIELESDDPEVPAEPEEVEELEDEDELQILPAEPVEAPQRSARTLSAATHTYATRRRSNLRQ